jgi:hypothetical protein
MTLWGFLSSLIWASILLYVLVKYAKQIKEILGTFTEFKIGKWLGIKRDSHAAVVPPPEPTGKIPPVWKEELSEEAQKVISTLWKHQKEYFPDDPGRGRWSFILGIGNPHYADYLMGVGYNLKKGLVTIDPKSGHCFLTDEGIFYCVNNQEKLLSDWNYARWKT